MIEFLSVEPENGTHMQQSWVRKGSTEDAPCHAGALVQGTTRVKH